ncbi:hypothetical protein DFH06DRAFT_1121289 [Mycena polygramma]|nr:hypothetical protein DFH06DRAFT_1121289 [Mycena polygramma]
MSRARVKRAIPRIWLAHESPMTAGAVHPRPEHGVHFSWCSFLGNQEKIPINGSPALAGRQILVFFDLFGPPKSDVTVTNTKSVQFRWLRHASLEHSVEIVQGFKSVTKNTRPKYEAENSKDAENQHFRIFR